MKKVFLGLVCLLALGSLTVFAQKADCDAKKDRQHRKLNM